MLAGEHDLPIDLAQVVVVLRPNFLRPVAGTSKGERYAMPCDGNAVLELRLVLRMNAGAECDGARHPFLGRHGGEFVRAKPDCRR